MFEGEGVLGLEYLRVRVFLWLGCLRVREFEDVGFKGI